MKSLINKFLISIFLILTSISISAQNIDPALSSAVVVSGAMEKSALDKINESQMTINAIQLKTENTLKKINKIQDKTLKYLSEVSNVIHDAYQVKKAADIAIDITNICTKELPDAIKQNKEGLLVSVIADSKLLTKIGLESSSIALKVKGIVLNKKVLMNSAERMMLLQQIVWELEQLRVKLRTLTYQVYTLNLADIPRLLSPELYYKTISGKEIAEQIIRDIKR